MPRPHPSLPPALASLDPGLRARLDGAGFDEKRFLELAATLTEGDPAARRAERNAVKGEVLPPKPGEIGRMPEPGTPEHARLEAVGQAALAAGELAFCTMAGGMATRMGGVVKALVDVLPGKSFLEMRLGENRSASSRAARPVPLWLMTSEATHGPLAEALATAPKHIALFGQDLSLRLTPDGELFVGGDGRPSIHATGHGDLPDALRRSGLLAPFRKAGGKYVWMTNIDNLGASIDAALLGRFIESGQQVQCEVCRKEGDKGGIPVHAEGALQVLEEFRLPATFDASQVDVFNCNTFLVKADALETAPLRWTYFEVEKKVDGKPAIQFERLVQEITGQLSTSYVVVPRDGAGSRFLPVKDFDELARRRADIEVVARARGMV